MITRIRIKNFQKHKRFDLDLEQVTSIIGRSDAGKSAILRAFYWVLFNRPSGDSIRRHGSDRTSVLVEIDEHAIVRVKGDGANGYLVDGKKLKAIGAGKVPVPVQSIANVAPENFQHQLESSFWLSESPGKVAKLLNKIVNLEVMDETVANVAAELRKTKTIVEISRSRLAEARQKRKERKWVPSLLNDYDRIEQLADKVGKLGRKRERLESLIISLENQTKKTIAVKVPDLTEIESAIGRLDVIQGRIGHLTQILSGITKERGELCRLEKSVLDLESRIKDVNICPACGTILSSHEDCSVPIGT